MASKLLSGLLLGLLALALAGTAQAKGGNYVIEGGSPEAQAQVRAALDASRFDWGRVTAQITIQITHCGCAGATPGTIILDEDVLTNASFGPRYAWGIVQHEYAHQVDFFLLQKADRKVLRKLLGGKDWCYEKAGLSHDDHGCERFADVFAWAFWRSEDNIQQTQARESAPNVRPAKFKRLVNRLLSS